MSYSFELHNNNVRIVPDGNLIFISSTKIWNENGNYYPIGKQFMTIKDMSKVVTFCFNNNFELCSFRRSNTDSENIGRIIQRIQKGQIIKSLNLLNILNISYSFGISFYRKKQWNFVMKQWDAMIPEFYIGLDDCIIKSKSLIGWCENYNMPCDPTEWSNEDWSIFALCWR